MRTLSPVASGKRTLDPKARLLSLPLKKIISGLFLTAFLVVGWPSTLGGSTGYVVVSGHSMEPTYQSGDLLITRTASTYQSGDVMVYDLPDNLAPGISVVHRVIGGNSFTGWLTQGDNNRFPDPWQPRLEDARGLVTFHIPSAGYLILLAGHPLFIAFLGSLVVASILWPRDEQPPSPATVTGHNDSGNG